MRPPARAKAVAVLREAGVEAGLQDLQQGLLNEPVEHGRNAKLPNSTATLGYLYP